MRRIDLPNLNLFLADSDLPYQAVEQLPVSGQREVYLATGVHDGAQYVVKVAQYGKYSVARIQREIKILNQLDSPYFPTILFNDYISEEVLERYYDSMLADGLTQEVEDYRADPFEPFYLTVENFVENITWEEFLKEAGEKGLCDLVHHCFHGLDQLWGNRIVHRDLKPENILIRPDGRPVIIDLGIAKSFNEGTADLTPIYFKNPHTVLYASPEQLTDRKEDINYKTDQYSMGIIVYNALCGKFPFGDIRDIGPDALVVNMMENNYTQISDSGGICCAEFEAFIRKLLSPHPHKRYRKTTSIFEAIEKVQGALL